MTDYTVRRITHGTVQMSDGRTEPQVTAIIYRDRHYVTSVRLNACTMCLPGGGVYGLDATDDQIISAVLGDEDIFTGTPAFPEDHDNVT